MNTIYLAPAVSPRRFGMPIIRAEKWLGDYGNNHAHVSKGDTIVLLAFDIAPSFVCTELDRIAKVEGVTLKLENSHRDYEARERRQTKAGRELEMMIAAQNSRVLGLV